MRRPRLAGVIERRLLVNYRLAPEVAARLLPPGLRPQLVRGHAVAGICLLRLADVRPGWAPPGVGLRRSENAAHRVAVEWDGPHGVRTGVYIPRRDTASPLTAWAGGRLFPGAHGRAGFEVRETPDRLRVACATRDATRLDVTVEVTSELRGSELFDDLAQASAFFERGATGYSPGRAAGALDGMELRTEGWRVDACRIVSARSSFFEGLPRGSAAVDCALVMRDVSATWRPLPPMRPAPPTPLPSGLAGRAG